MHVVIYIVYVRTDCSVCLQAGTKIAVVFPLCKTEATKVCRPSYHTSVLLCSLDSKSGSKQSKWSALRDIPCRCDIETTSELDSQFTV